MASSSQESNHSLQSLLALCEVQVGQLLPQHVPSMWVLIPSSILPHPASVPIVGALISLTPGSCLLFVWLHIVTMQHPRRGLLVNSPTVCRVCLLHVFSKEPDLACMKSYAYGSQPSVSTRIGCKTAKDPEPTHDEVKSLI